MSKQQECKLMDDHYLPVSPPPSPQASECNAETGHYIFGSSHKWSSLSSYNCDSLRQNNIHDVSLTQDSKGLFKRKHDWIQNEKLFKRSKKRGNQSLSKFTYSLSKAFPHLSKHIAVSTVSGPSVDSSHLVTSSGALETETKVKCCTCSSYVSKENLKNHLYFGSMICMDCDYQVDECSEFTHIVNATNLSCHCKHKRLSWKKDASKYLMKKLKNRACITLKGKSAKSLEKDLNNYLNQIQPLWDISPWSRAVDECKFYLSDSHSESAQISSAVASTEKKFEETLELPTDGRYLIVKESVEECPDCYTRLNIRHLKFNCCNGLISYVCRTCHLDIYFVLTPPNDEESYIKIIQ